MTVIDFTMTMKSIEKLLLTEVIRCERPDLEERTQAVEASISDNQCQLSDTEEQMLSLLASYSGDVLSKIVAFDRFFCNCCI